MVVSFACLFGCLSLRLCGCVYFVVLVWILLLLSFGALVRLLCLFWWWDCWLALVSPILLCGMICGFVLM